MNLRWRLTVFYGAVLAFILALVGVAVFFAVRASVHQTMDDNLRDAATLAATQLSGDEGNPKLDAQTDRFQTRLPGATMLKVFDKNGILTDQFGTIKTKFVLTPGFASVGEFRAFTTALPDGGWIQAIRSDVESLMVLQRIQRLIVLGLPFFLLAGLGGGYLLADHALKPVDDVSRLASSIAASGRYKDRVPELPGHDEMARLTQTVNAMLGKLDATIERERAFALAAAHEFRTPLALLRGQSSLLLKHERTPDEYQKGLRMVEQTSIEMTNLTESLLAFAKTNQVAQQQTIDLEDLAIEAVEALSSTAKAQTIQLVLQTKSAATHGDPATLRLVISNLVGNAIKYNHRGGRVWIRTSSHQDHVTLEVCDDGPGIKPEDLERLLQPFQRGLGLQGVRGAGLGLALVQAVIEQHHGKLEFGRADEGGLKARITIPQ